MEQFATDPVNKTVPTFTEKFERVCEDCGALSQVYYNSEIHVCVCVCVCVCVSLNSLECCYL